MRKILYFLIALTVLSFASCKDTEGSIGDPIIAHGQDRDTDTITGDDYVYHLPVIFHVFYSNTTQYIEYTRLKEILSNVNELYQGDVYNYQMDTIPSENLHILFELAEKNESGKRLSTPGVEYIKVPEPEFDCESFMKDKKYVQYCWDQNNYINVMVYAFKKTDENSTTLGISHLPYQVGGYPQIDGLSNGKNYPLSKPGKFPYCVSLNSIYVGKDYEGTRYTEDKYNRKYKSNTADPNATLAHELGHYLGLFHSFSEKTVKGKSETANDDDDSDHCDDTPSYNRIEYSKWVTLAIKKDSLTLRDVAKRTNSKGEEWQSDNLMDYFYCYSMRFTPEQANRIRQVLYYSPLIPGPKKVRPRTRAWDEMPETEDDLPIRYAKEKAVSIKDIRILKAEK